MPPWVEVIPPVKRMGTVTLMRLEEEHYCTGVKRKEGTSPHRRTMPSFGREKVPVNCQEPLNSRKFKQSALPLAPPPATAF